MLAPLLIAVTRPSWPTARLDGAEAGAAASAASPTVGAMPLFSFEGKAPQVHPDAWIAPTATLVGDVRVEAHASVWYGAVLRADFGPIVIREGANVQDGLGPARRRRPGHRGRAGATIGHLCVVHGAVIGAGRAGRQRRRGAGRRPDRRAIAGRGPQHGPPARSCRTRSSSPVRRPRSAARPRAARSSGSTTTPRSTRSSPAGTPPASSPCRNARPSGPACRCSRREQLEQRRGNRARRPRRRSRCETSSALGAASRPSRAAPRRSAWRSRRRRSPPCAPG